MYKALAVFLHITLWHFHITTVSMEMQQWVQCVLFSHMSTIYIAKMLPQKYNNIFSLYCCWGVKYLLWWQQHLGYCNSPITFSSDRRTDRYEEAKSNCLWPCNIHIKYYPKSHPPHLNREQDADADALACVSRGHCDGLGGEGVLLNTQPYLLWEQRSAACEPSPALCLVHLKTSSCMTFIHENKLDPLNARYKKEHSEIKSFGTEFVSP